LVTKPNTFSLTSSSLLGKYVVRLLSTTRIFVWGSKSKVIALDIGVELVTMGGGGRIMSFNRASICNQSANQQTGSEINLQKNLQCQRENLLISSVSLFKHLQKVPHSITLQNIRTPCMIISAIGFKLSILHYLVPLKAMIETLVNDWIPRKGREGKQHKTSEQSSAKTTPMQAPLSSTMGSTCSLKNRSATFRT
jgi:hypothetical protein